MSNKLERDFDPLDNSFRVETPENIAFQYRLAGPFRRVNAYLLDLAIVYLSLLALAVVTMALLVVLILPLLGRGPAGGTAIQNIFGVVGMIGRVMMFVVHWFYGAIMESYFGGRTLGKMMLGMRVKSTDGSAIDGAQATLRNFFRLFDLFPMVSVVMVFGLTDAPVEALPTAMFGFLCMTISSKYQRLGDLVAGTIVVVEDKKWTHGLAKFEDARVPQLAELIPKGFVASASLARALSDFVDRRRFLPYQRVVEIAAHLGQPLVDEFGLPKDTNHDLLLCSLYYKTFIDQQQDEAIPAEPVGVPQIAQTELMDSAHPIDSNDPNANPFLPAAPVSASEDTSR